MYGSRAHFNLHKELRTSPKTWNCWEWETDFELSVGQSIQSAIDAAKPGATIVVKAGYYKEQLTIKTDGIALVGQKGTVLLPPKPAIPEAKQNLCFGTAGPGTIAGICVVGKNVKLKPYPGQEHSKIDKLGRRVKGVSITGFEVSSLFLLRKTHLWMRSLTYMRDRRLATPALFSSL